jgi:hypothetical protein
MSNSITGLPMKMAKEFKVVYTGGHKAYPKRSHTKIRLYDDEIELMDPHLKIPYSHMTKIENMDEKKISALRVVALGLVFLPLAVVGALWKKKYLYTVIQYNDGIDGQTVVLDFGKKIDQVQPLIYQKMLYTRQQ